MALYIGCVLLPGWSETRPMLGSVACPGFSKTARSHPAHREASRHSHHASALAIRDRRLADDVAEGAAEGAQAVEADVEANVSDASLGLAQQEHRALDAAALQVAVRRLAERRAKGSDEVRFRHVGDAREHGDVERIRVGTVHRIAGAKHSTVDLLAGSTHPGITTRCIQPREYLLSARVGS